MKDKIGNSYVIIGVVVIFVLIFGGIFLVSNLKPIKTESESDVEANKREVVSCDVKEDCDDGSECTIDSCIENECLNTEVTLCYNNDGCCPVNCNSGNDNDCLSQ